MDYLSRYKESMMILSQISDRLATLRSKIGSPTGSGLVMSDKGKASSILPSDPLYTESLQIMEVEAVLAKQLKESAKLEREITHIIYDALPEKTHAIENEILMNIYVYTYSIDRVYRSMNMLRKTFDYYKDKALSIVNAYLIARDLIIPFEMRSGAELLINKIVN